MVNNWLNIIQNYLLPPTCILCNSPGYLQRDLCQDCYQDLPRIQHGCVICAIALPVGAPEMSICGDCQSWPPAFDHTIAGYQYQHSMRYLVTQLKFNAQFKNARLLGQLLAEKAIASSTLPEAILPVPLHNNRYRERKFNQCIEIGKEVSRQLHIPLLLDTCIRQRDTPHQAELKRKQRLKNLHNAFAMQRPLDLQHVAILDDVMTTGTTLHEMAYLLKKNGVKRVDAWVCARA